MTITLRRATEADVPAIARIGCDAFNSTSGGMIAALFPPHLQRPGHDAQEAWRAARKSGRLRDAGSVIMVAVERGGAEEEEEEDGPDGGEVVVGYAWWSLPGAVGNFGATVGASDDALAKLGETFPPELDREAMMKLRQQLLEGEHVIFGKDVPRNWYELEIIAVDPNHQRKGAGKKLVQWGLEMAAPEQKDVFLCASRAGKPLYASLGFRELGTADLFGEAFNFMVVKNNPDSVVNMYTPPSREGPPETAS